MSSEIMVSVCCAAYNHEKYIRDALDGFVMQKTNFKFEVLIHDDASTDSTADIIREYEKKYPDIIKPMYQKENQYSKGIHITNTYQIPRAQGKYIALCEGDDYWTDPLKLQKQFDAMEKNPIINICAHRAVMVKEETKEAISEVAPANSDTVLSVEQVIVGEGGYVVTSSLFFKKNLFTNVPGFRKTFMIDYTLQIYGALSGGMLYLNDSMSAYRIRMSDSWTSETMKNKEKRINFWKRSIEMRNMLNKETEYKYNEAIETANVNAQIMIFRITGQYKEIKKEPYLSVYKTYSKKKKLYMHIERYCPVFLSLWKKFKGKV